MSVRSWKHRVMVGAAALVLGLAITAFSSPPAAVAGHGAEHPPSRSGITPVINSNFADPGVLRVGGTYHAYATNSGGQNIQHRTSTDLVHWKTQPDAAPTLGAWVGACSFAPGGATDHCVWAPQVTAVPGGYNLYYTARDKLAPRQCIGVSFSTSPGGPFVPVGSDPLVCPDGQRGAADLGGAIDASTYRDHGQLYLLWKADGNCCNLSATIFIQPLTSDGRALTGPPTPLINNDRPFEGRVVEAPTLVKHSNTYYLFYSANDFGGGNYRTGYATATNIAGPYTKSRTELMTTDLFHGTVIGPGGQDIFTTAEGSTAIVFHGWDPTYSYRAMYVSDLSWSPAGVPSVDAADRRYQAEDGVITDAHIVTDGSASGQAKVGGMDHPDSSVTVRMYADRAGPATLGIRYANGSRDAGGNGVPATDSITVNGVNGGVLTLPNTAWGNWSTAEHRVKLTRGWNTVTLIKLTYFAEIDAIDLFRAASTHPQVAPPTPTTDAVRYEAENGVIVHARVVGDATASAGVKVGGLDFPDSSVTVTVYAAKAGPATLGIRYGNGSLDPSGYPVLSTDTLRINSRRAGTVTFSNTTWENWTTLNYPVQLRKGANTITLTKQTFYAELDAIDVYPASRAGR